MVDATENPQGAGAKMLSVKAQLYGEILPTSRPISALWLVPQILLMGLALIVTTVVLTLILAVPLVMVAIGHGVDVASLRTSPPSWFIGALSFAGMLSLFIGFYIVSFAKTKMEKRSLHSAGLDGFLYGGRFWKGFGGGILLAVVLSLPAALMGSMMGLETEASLNWDNLMTSQFALAAGLIFLFVLVQAPAEEVFFRGWMMSGLAARHGIAISIIISTLIFGAFHLDRLAAGPIIGLYVFIAVSGIGLVLAALSVASRSVIPAAGVHSGYNVTLITVGLAYVVAGSDNPDLMAAIMEMFDFANMEPPVVDGKLFVDMAVRVLVPVGLAVWFLRRRTA